MPVRYTENPSATIPGEVVGAPVRIPALLMCSGKPGRRPCGWMRTANTPQQYAEYALERRKHEETCKGGLIVPGAP